MSRTNILEVKPVSLKTNDISAWKLNLRIKLPVTRHQTTNYAKTFQKNASPFTFVLHLFTLSETEINYQLAYVPLPQNQWDRPHKYFRSNFCKYNEIIRFILISLITTDECLSGTIHKRYNKIHSTILRTVSCNSRVCGILGSRSGVVKVFDLLWCCASSMRSFVTDVSGKRRRPPRNVH